MSTQQPQVATRDAELTDYLEDESTRTAAPLALRSPASPTTVEQLAAQAHPSEIALARATVIATLRLASLRGTHPEDWVLFKSPDEHGGQITGYLQDAGCDRVRDIWGIEVFNVSKPERVSAADGSFHYLITGDGRCRVTQQIIESVEGGRSSTDDFCRGKTGVELELTVRKAARANLDGNITRALAGLASMPLDEILRGWDGQNKDPNKCRKGRGFGTHSERLGGRSESAPDVDPPTCAVCGKTGVFRAGRNGRPGFYGCPNYQSHQDKKWIVDAEKWVAQQQGAAAPPAPAAAATPAPSAASQPASSQMRASEIFGNTRGTERQHREPGYEG